MKAGAGMSTDEKITVPVATFGVSEVSTIMVWSEVFVNSCISMEKSCNEQFVNVFSNQKKTVHYSKLHNVFEQKKWTQLVR